MGDIICLGTHLEVSGISVQAERIKKRAAYSENFLGGLVCTGNLAFRLQ